MFHYAITSTLSILGMIVVLGASGWFVIAPFAKILPQPALASPLVGMVVGSSFSLLIYVGLNLPMPFAGGIAFTICLILSGLSLRQNPPPLAMRLGLMIVAVLIPLAVLTMLPAFRLGEPASVFRIGTDQFGYAQVADWLNQHLVSVAPRQDSNKPYESWPAKMFLSDPRFGSYEVLALTALALKLPSLFAYDPACTLVLVVSCLSMAGLFGRTKATMIMLLIGLAGGQWFDLGRTGFLGKIIGYPSALMVAGLLLRLPDMPADAQPKATMLLLLLAMAAAPMYPGIALAFLVALIAGTALLARAALYRQGLAMLTGNNTLTAIILVLALAMASGLVSRPLGPSYPQSGMDWSGILCLLGGLIRQGGRLSEYPFGLGHAAVGIMMAAWAGLVLLAGRNRAPSAISLLLCPIAEVAVLFVVDAPDFAAQLLGFTLPAVLIGAAQSCDATPASHRRTALFLTSLLVALPLPRLIDAIVTIDGPDVPSQSVLALSEMTALFDRIDGGSALVDVALPQQLPLTLLVHNTTHPRLVWSPSAWRAIVGYRRWPAPPQTKPADYTIVRADTPVAAEAVLVRTRQYLLLRQTADWPGLWQYPKTIVGPTTNLGADYEVDGLWSDQWMDLSMRANMSGGDAQVLHLRFDVPRIEDPNFTTDVEIVINGKSLYQAPVAPGEITLNLPIPPAPTRQVEVHFTKGQKLRSPDTRVAAGRLREMFLQ